MTKLKVITGSTCSRCRSYVKEAAQYVDEIEEANIMTEPSIRRVPHSRLFVDGTLVKEWEGANLEPLHSYLGGNSMKVKFLTECRDKYTNETYKKGATRVFSDERAKDFIEAGVAKEVKAKNDTDNDK